MGDARSVLDASRPLRILIIHRNPLDAASRAHRLNQPGLSATGYPVVGPSAFRQIRADPPDAILIDLTQLPSYGRIMGGLLREQKATRPIPLVFLEGDPEKSARVREALPDVQFAVWPDVMPAIRRAIRQTPAEPGLPIPPKVTVATKLRLRAGAEVGTLHAPAEIRKILGPLPKDVRIHAGIGEARIVLVFAKSAAALGRELPRLADQAVSGRTFWICWPKRKSETPSDLSPNRIREMAVPYGLIDSKICALDATWSATALTRRRKG